jgi:tRNA threonylcarbamoyladenosine biosynthesis protein TsaB
MNTLILIDTSSNKEIKIGLSINGEEYVIAQQIDTRKAQVTLPLIKKILREYNLGLKDLTAIEVKQGPGSFTGLRVGIAIANTLGFLLNIPVNGKDMVEPVYT